MSVATSSPTTVAMGDAQSSTAPAPLLPAQAGAPRTWVRKIQGGGAVVESCPSWCTATHANDQDIHLDDLTHSGPAVAMRLPMHVQGTGGTMAWPVLSATIHQWPYEEDAESRAPYVSFEPSADEIIELDVDGLAQVIHQIRAHADRLEGVLAQLVQARAGYGVQAG